MITRGSKFFYAAAAVGFAAAVVYGFLSGAAEHSGVIGVFQDGDVVNSIVGPLTFGWKGWVGDHVGYSVLMGFAAVMAALGGFSTAFRDGSPDVLVQMEGGDAATAVNPAVLTPIGLSYWPLVGAFGVGIAVVGLAVDPVLFWVGAILLAVVLVSWTVRAWAERATGDQTANRQLRHDLLDPLEVPVLAVLTLAVIVLCVSRLLLALPQEASVYVIIVAAVVVFGLAFVLAGRPELKRSLVVAVLLVGGVVLIGAGIAGGVAGEQHVGEEEHGAAANPAVVVDSASASGAVDTLPLLAGE
ncbi:hypothetical protein [Dermatobacter hominis]|uniref:hypothetical protein n=1 Tax=Dermatobacter hominis TaxID=2884263 RepID=UPI001D1226FB|nr:hypothetical protein [Dermatobacter hominis]UDY34076.1 hypothetical protein LH044_12040 [Dermatobacter hominis]